MQNSPDPHSKSYSKGVLPVIQLSEVALSVVLEFFDFAILITDYNLILHSLNNHAQKLLKIKNKTALNEKLDRILNLDSQKLIGKELLPRFKDAGFYESLIDIQIASKKVSVYVIVLRIKLEGKDFLLWFIDKSQIELNRDNIFTTVHIISSMVNSLPLPIMIYDVSSEKIKLPGSCLFNELGYDASQIEDQHKHFIQIADKNDFKKIQTHISKFAKKSGAGFNDFSIRLKNADGYYVDYKIHLSELKSNEKGEVSHIICYFEKCIESSGYQNKIMNQVKEEYEETLKTLVDSSLDAVYILDGRKLLLVNKAWLDLFGYSEDEVYDDKFDVLQIVAHSSRPKIFEKLEHSVRKTIAKSNYEMQGLTKSGDIVDLDVYVNLIKWKGKYVYKGVYKNISEKKYTEKSKQLQSNLLDCTAKITSLFLADKNFDRSIDSAFQIIGSALSISRIYLYENISIGNSNEHLMKLRYEWAESKVAKRSSNHISREISYKKFPGWYSKLSSDSEINCNVKDLPYSIKDNFEQEKTLSILIVPIIVENKFWGIIGLDECKYEREWEESEIALLRTTGNSFGNALLRINTEYALVESEERYRFLFDQAADLIIILNTKNIIVNVNKTVESEIGWKRDELIGKNILTTGILTSDSKNVIIKNISENSVSKILEIELVKTNGLIIPFELNTIPILKNGNLINLQLVLRNIKERKENERNLKESEQKYRNIFENVQDIFFQTDLHGAIITISPSIERYSGYKPEELIGKKVVTFYATPKDRAKMLKEMQEKNEVSDFIIRLRHKLGKTVFVSVNSHMLKNKYGEIIGIEGSLRDVTEREIAHEEIRKLSRAVEQSPSTVTITDTQGRIVYVNPKFSESTGYSLSEVIGKNPSILKSGEMTVEQYKVLWDTISAGKEWKGEFHNKKKNGEYFWESASISPIKNENGEITHFLAVKEDITEKKNQEKKLLRFQNLLKGVSESVQNLISEKDFDHAIKKALKALGKGSGADRVYIFENSITISRNESFMNLKYDWHNDDRMTALDDEFMNNFIAGNSHSDLQKSIKGNRSFNAVANQLSESDQSILRRYGTLSLLIVPIYVDKQFWGFIGFDNCHGTEPWSESEESILVAAAATIGRAIEREKTNNELIRAKEEAEKAERLKSEFLAQISHEIRSPLNVLLNYSQLFRDVVGDKIDPEIFQGFDGMENAGNRIIRTIDLLLNISEIQTGSYSFRAKSLDIYSDIIFPLFNEYKKLARGKNIIFNIIRHTDNTKMSGDEYSVMQIFANLIDNAIKYTNEGKIEIFIDRNFNNKLFIKISDSGIGISEHYLPQMYLPFSQEEQGYTRSYEGNGLGLALVKKYCELNNADIFVDSVKGKGTTFTVIFNL